MEAGWQKGHHAQEATNRRDPLMAERPSGRVSALYRYPVKGLTGESLERVVLTPGETLPFDRAYAIENGAGRFHPEAPRHLPKINFLMLMRDERLATLKTEFDEVSHMLTVLRDGKKVAGGQLNTKIGRQLIEQFIAEYMRTELRGAPKIMHAPDHSFSDMAAKCVHIVNLGTVRELERTLGRSVDPLRFRANIYVDGVEPWAELDWLDKPVRIGPAHLAVFARTTRCEAIDVDPNTGARDMAIPAHLMRTWAHQDFGIYAKVVVGGSVAIGAPVNQTPIPSI
jgi:hypothetical protein